MLLVLGDSTPHFKYVALYVTIMDNCLFLMPNAYSSCIPLGNLQLYFIKTEYSLFISQFMESPQPGIWYIQNLSKILSSFMINLCKHIVEYNIIKRVFCLQAQLHLYHSLRDMMHLVSVSTADDNWDLPFRERTMLSLIFFSFS